MNYTKGKWNCTCEAGYKGEVIHCPLHAAAPDMYEALKDFGLYVAVNYDENNKPFYYIDKEWEDKRKQALAKAEGK